MRTIDYSALRPWPELAPADLALLKHVYERVRESNEVLPRRFLRFETNCSDADLARLRELDLLAVDGEGFVPTVLALLYLPEAAVELERLAELVRLAHERYHPSHPTLPARELGTHWTPFLQRLASELYLQVSAKGDVVLTEWNWELASFADAFCKRYGRQLHRERMSVLGAPAPTLAALPFAFRLTGLRARRFRALREVALKLGSLTALVGSNGVGKSTLLDTLLFLKTATRESLGRAVDNEGGFARLRTRGSEGPIELGISFDIDHGHGPIAGSYELSFDMLGNGPIVERERLLLDDWCVFEKRRGQTRVFSKNGAPRDELGPADHLGLSLLAALDDDTVAAGIHRAISQSVLIDRDPLILIDAAYAHAGHGRHGVKARSIANLLPLLSRLASDEHALAKLTAVTRELIPAIERIEALQSSGEEPQLLIHMRDIPGPLFIDELSSGTRQILLFAALYVAPTPYQVILAEEADAGLHPAGQAALVDLLHSLAQRSTLVLTTHSPSFVSRLSPDEEIIAMSASPKGPQLSPLAEVIASEPWLKDFGDHGEAFARRGDKG